MIFTGFVLCLGLANPPSKTTAAPIYSWKNVCIVAGGFVDGITYHPKQQGLAYARTDIGGAYRWDPLKSRWIPLLDWLTKRDWNLYGIESLAIDPTDPHRLYLACGTYTQSWAGNGAILASRDDGKTFSRADLPFKLGGNEDGRSMGERLAVDPQDGRRLFFGSRNRGLWFSGDRAAHWSQVADFPVKGPTNGFGVTSIVFDARKPKRSLRPSRIYAGIASHSSNLFESFDEGTSWQPVKGAPSGFFVNHMAMSQDGKLFVTYSNTSGPNNVTDGAVYRLDIDSGVWADITPIKPHSGKEEGFGYAGLAIDPKDGHTIAVSTMDRWGPGDDVFYSTDSGLTWSGLAARSKRDASAAPYMTWGQPVARFGWWIGAVALDPFQTSRVLYGTGANIWGSDDVLPNNVALPTQWTIRGTGIEETADIDLLSPHDGPHLISGLGDIGGFTHFDLDRPSDGMTLNPLLDNTDSLAASKFNGVVIRVGRPSRGQRSGGISRDNGLTWQAFATLPLPHAVGGSVAVGSDGKVIVWSPQGLLPYRSGDDAMTWEKANGINEGVQVVGDPLQPDQFFALGNSGKIYSSFDGGRNFASVSDQLTNSDPKSIVAFPDYSGWLFAMTSKGLFLSQDGCKSFSKWTDVDEVDSVGFGMAKPGDSRSTIFLNGSIRTIPGVYRSDDFGKSWLMISDADHQYGTRGKLIGDPRIFGRVYMGTNGRGVLYGDPISRKSRS